MTRPTSRLPIVLLVLAAGGLGFLLARWQRQDAGIDLPVAAAELPTPQQMIGRAAPAMAWVDLQLQPFALADFRGQTVLLNFWASWCAPCIEEMPVLDAFARDPDNGGVQVIGIALDQAQPVRDFLQAHPVAYRIALGTTRFPDESNLLGNHRSLLPYSVLIGPDGVVRKTRMGGFDAAQLAAWVRL